MVLLMLEHGEKILRKLRGAIVEVHLFTGDVLRGRLVDVDPQYMNILLEDVEYGKKKILYAFVSGGSITYFFILSPPLKGLLSDSTQRRGKQKKVFEEFEKSKITQEPCKSGVRRRNESKREGN